MACTKCREGTFEMRSIPFTVGDEVLGDFEAYVCPVCSETFFTEESSHAIQVLLETRKAEGVKILTPEEWSLILLYAQKEHPICGAIMFMKQLFLVFKEVIPRFRIPSTDFGYFSYSYGPNSTDVSGSWETLERKGDIRTVGVRSTNKEYFFLTDKGGNRARILFESLPDTLKLELAEKRHGWDNLGIRGILKRVYTDYREYTDKSKIRHKVLPNRYRRRA